MSVIIKSGKMNWSGKEFSSLPAKIYPSFDDAVSALNSYHFFVLDAENCEYVVFDKTQKIQFIFLNESKEKKMLATGSVRR
jgi:hypothetical protein